MVESDTRTPTLGEAARQFLSTLSAQKMESHQPEVFRFARWYGWESPFSKLAPPAVASYAEQLSASDTDYAQKLQIIRSFLAYAKKAGWSRVNLSTHLKTKKAKTGQGSAGGRVSRETVSLTRERYDEMQAELTGLKTRSRELIGEIQRAAADKDFRENAPLAAAREERGHVEGRIKEMEEALKRAVILDDKKEPTHKTSVGDSVVICDLASGEELCYMIVDPREVDVAKGKISMASPLGKALIGRRNGDTIEITAPVGKMRYEIRRIER